MVTTKKESKKVKQQLSKRSVVILSALGAVLLLVGIMWLNSNLEERRTLSELSELNTHMRALYNQMLTANTNNVASSDFGNKCSESSVEIGRGRIVCGVRGVIVLKNDIGLERAGRIMESSVMGNSLNSNAKANIYNSQYFEGVSLDYVSPYHGIVCDGSYGQSTATKQWSYSLSCRKDVPDFLPSYTIEKR